MAIDIRNDRFSTEAEARAKIEQTGYEALIGLSVDPATLTQPIDKPPPVRR